MKFTIEKSVLSEALSSASKACAVRSTIPALEGVLICLKNNEITVTGYDLEIGIKCIIKPEQAVEDGEIVVNAKIFSEMVKKMPSGLVEIASENDTVTIRCGSNVCDLMGVSGDNYPNIPELKKDISFEVDESVMKSMIRQTIHAVAVTDIKPVHMGSKFHIENNILSVVSVDGVRMAKRTEPVEYSDIDFVVPKKTLDEFMKMLSDEPNEKKVTVCIDRNQICFSKEDYMIISRLLEGNFIDYEKIMNFEEKSSAVVNALDFSTALDRTLVLNTDKYKCPVICTFDNDSLHIDIKTSVGKMNIDIPVKYTGDKLEIAFNARYMIDALKNSECDEVRVDFTGPLFPIRIRPLEDDSFVGIVLPVRSK
ncbi:MAG: DNA polymerase III subunit beta [Ruminiclostridium sp.]|nr:DNA polymerase III subunit beta [Ruminiclostridium sp.]